MRRNIRPPVKWHGGKYYLAKRITDLFPAYQTYVEPFGGAASVLLNKPPAPVEVYNDLDGRLTRLFRVIRDEPDEFRRLLTLTPYSEVEFDYAAEPSDNEIELARRDFVRWRQSIGGRADAFSYTRHRVRRGMADVVSGWLSAIDDELPKIIDRLRDVQILNRPAIELLRKYDGANTLFYLDPPYLHQTRASKQAYRLEMTDDDHRELLKVVQAIKGKVVLSGYSSDLYSEFLSEFEKIEIEIANHAAGGDAKRRMTEVIWKNY